MLVLSRLLWIASCLYRTIEECLRTTRPRDRLHALPTRTSSSIRTVHISVSLTKVTLTCSRWARLWPLGVQALAAWSHLTHPNWSSRLGLGVEDVIHGGLCVTSSGQVGAYCSNEKHSR